MDHDSDEAVVQRASEVIVNKPGIGTASGAQVGMTLADIRATYGSAVKLDTKQGVPDYLYTATVREGVHELVFISSHDLQRPLRDSDVITEMVAREYSSQLGGVC